MGLQKTYIKSNFRKNINELKLNEKYENLLGDNWWHGVEHGLALLGHISPIIHKYKIGKHYIPSTYSINDSDIKCGSFPTIDENFIVSNCKTIHDGFEYTRMNKVDNIIKFYKNNNIKLPFRTCYQERKELINCCNCEKCYRTIMELVSLGENPNEYGYKYNQSIVNKIHNFLIDVQFDHKETRNIWLDIKKTIIKSDNYYSKYDIEWIKKINF